jgi:hypothetical protein
MGGKLFMTGKGFELERNSKNNKIKRKERMKQTHFALTNRALFTIPAEHSQATLQHF